MERAATGSVYVPEIDLALCLGRGREAGAVSVRTRPEQIVAFIDEKLPSLVAAAYVDRTHEKTVRSLLTLLTRWDERGLSPNTAHAYLIARSECDAAVRNWDTAPRRAMQISGDVILEIKRAAAEAAANPPEDPLAFVRNDDSRDRIRESLDQAEDNMTAKNWGGALASGLKVAELLLLDALMALDEGKLQEATDAVKQRGDPTRWNLATLARGAGTVDLLRADHVDVVVAAANIANRKHPGREMRDDRPAARAEARTVMGACELIMHDLGRISTTE